MVISSLNVTQNKEYVEHEVPLLHLDENVLLPFDFHHRPVVLIVANEFFVQANNHQFQSIFVFLNGYATHDLHDLFQGGQEQCSFITNLYFKQQLQFLN